MSTAVRWVLICTTGPGWLVVAVLQQRRIRRLEATIELLRHEYTTLSGSVRVLAERARALIMLNAEDVQQ